MLGHHAERQGTVIVNTVANCGGALQDLGRKRDRTGKQQRQQDGRIRRQDTRLLWPGSVSSGRGAAEMYEKQGEKHYPNRNALAISDQFGVIDPGSQPRL